jgi:hypothetical protein
MKRTFLTFSLLVAGTSLLMNSSDAEARGRCRYRGGQRYQSAYYQPANTYAVNGTTTTTPYATVDPNAAPANPAPVPPEETAAPQQAPAAPAPGT